MADYNIFKDWYTNTLEYELQLNYHCGNSIWTEAAAVGSKEFIKTISANFPSRKKKILFAQMENKIKNEYSKIAEEETAYLTYNH